MCTTGESDLELVQTGMAGLTAADVTLQSDEQVRAELLALLAIANQVHAAVLIRSAAFDARGLAEGDGFRTGRAWLTAFGRLSPAAAGA